MKILNITAARNQFPSLATGQETTLLTKNNETVSAIVPYSLYQEMYRAWKQQRREKLIKRALEEEKEDVTHEFVLKELGLKHESSRS